MKTVTTVALVLAALVLSAAQAAENTSTVPRAKEMNLDEDACVGSRVLSVVAHADDDLYFINPAIDAAIARGACVHTVVVTGGYVDNPDNRFRLAGLKAAYAAMAQRSEDENGVDSKSGFTLAPSSAPGTKRQTENRLANWHEEWLTVAGKPVQRLTLAGRPKIQLSFLHLPCGSHDDTRPRQPPTLYELYTARDQTVTVGPQAGVTYDQVALVVVLKALIRQWDPDTVYTLQPHRKYPVRHSRPGGEGAHPDHVIVARLLLTALIGETRVRTVRVHDDYPIQDLPANLNLEQAQRKTDILKAYCREDVRGCANPDTLNPACRAEDADGWGEAWLCRYYPQRVPNRD